MHHSARDVHHTLVLVSGDFSASAPWGTNETACPSLHPGSSECVRDTPATSLSWLRDSCPKLMTETPSRLLVEEMDSVVQLLT